MVTTLMIHTREPPGDVLIFLTGQEEIEAAEELLKQWLPLHGLDPARIAPIYANLPSDLQVGCICVVQAAVLGPLTAAAAAPILLCCDMSPFSHHDLSESCPAKSNLRAWIYRCGHPQPHSCVEPAC